MKRLLAIVAVAVVAVVSALSGCVPDIDADAPVSLGALDPALLANAGTLIFSFSTTKKCADLMDLAPDAIGTLLAPEGAPLQPLRVNKEDHVFGKVPPNVPLAYFVLATPEVTGQRVELAQLKGTVFAMGCRDFTAPAGTRRDLPLTLFPVGLR